MVIFFVWQKWASIYLSLHHIPVKNKKNNNDEHNMGTQCSEQQHQLLFIFPASCQKRNLGNNSTATLSVNSSSNTEGCSITMLRCQSAQSAMTARHHDEQSVQPYSALIFSLHAVSIIVVSHVNGES